LFRKAIPSFGDYSAAVIRRAWRQPHGKDVSQQRDAVMEIASRDEARTVLLSREYTEGSFPLRTAKRRSGKVDISAGCIHIVGTLGTWALGGDFPRVDKQLANNVTCSYETRHLLLQQSPTSGRKRVAVMIKEIANRERFFRRDDLKSKGILEKVQDRTSLYRILALLSPIQKKRFLEDKVSIKSLLHPEVAKRMENQS